MHDFSNYFNNIANILDSNSEMGGIVGHNGNIGNNRENILGEFLGNHIPKCLHLYYGGRILGLKSDKPSRQIDIIITNNIAFNFLDKMQMSTYVESLSCAISVKSKLTKNELINSLENLASIPEIDPDVLSFRGYIEAKKVFVDFINKHPSLFIFAYDGISPDTLIKHLHSYLKENIIQPNRIPTAIIVNKKYIITYHKTTARTKNGDVIPANTFHSAKITSDQAGYPLAYMLNAVSAYVDFLPFMKLDAHHYINKGYELNKL